MEIHARRLHLRDNRRPRERPREYVCKMQSLRDIASMFLHGHVYTYMTRLWYMYIHVHYVALSEN